jgi:hypothetical protein
MVKEAIEAAGEGIKKSAVGAEKLWEATKEGASEAAEWAQEKSKQGWDKTKKISGPAWEATKEAAEDTTHTVKESYEVVKDKAQGALN